MVKEDKDMEQLQQELDKPMDWSHEWQMLFNASKCRVIHFGKNKREFHYTMGGHARAGTVLEAVVEDKDVGVTRVHN